jgi:hypothetical protein
MAVKFKDTININGEYTFPNTDGSVGQAIVTDGGGNLTFGSVAAASADSAESTHLNVKNISGASIAKGTPVYVTGNVGNTDKLEIAPADASNASHMPAIGLLESTLANNGEGFVVQGGLLKGLVTDTIDGSSSTANDTVYVKAGGGLTLTKPTGSTNFIQNIAKVARVHSSNGSLIVSSILRTNDVPNLSTGKIWVGDDNTIESTVVHIDELNGRVGIGTDSPSDELHITGTTASIRLQDSDGTNTFGRLRYTGSSVYFTSRNNTSNGNFIFIGSNGTSDTEYMRIKSGGDISFRDTSANEAFYWDASTASLGIGTTSPSAKLEIVEASPTDGIIADFVNSTNAGGTTAAIKLSNAVQGACDVVLGANRVGANFGSDFFISLSDSTDGTNQERFRITEAGNVGIGTLSPRSVLESKGVISVGDTQTTLGSNDPLAGVDFYTSDTSFASSNTNRVARIFPYSDEPLGQAFGLKFSTADTDTDAAVRMTIESSGNVGINTITPSVSLDISGTDAIQVPKGLTSDRPTPASGMFRFNTTTNEFEGYNGTEWAPIGGANAASIDVDSFTGDAVETAFTLSSAISEEVATQIYIDGVYQSKDNYSTSGTTLTFTDAPADGASIEVVHFTGISESDLNGSGTTNYISKWLDTDTLTNSIIYDNGTNVGIGTASPNAELEIHGNLNIGDGTSVTSIGLQRNSANYITATDAAGYLVFRTGGATERMRIHNGGDISFRDTSNNQAFYWDASTARLGIGAGSSPESTLHIKANQDSTNGGIRLESLDGTQYATIDMNNAGNLRFYQNGVSRMRIDSTGNVGIGEASPDNRIHIKGGTDATSSIKLEKSGSSTAILTSYYIGTTTSDDFRFLTNGAEKMRITSGGNVGIGTTNPASKLTVSGDTYTSGQFAQGVAIANKLTNYGAEFRSTGSSAQIFFGRDGDSVGTGAIGADSNNTFIVWDSSFNKRFTILSNGNVGIGTASPSVKLQANGNIRSHFDSTRYVQLESNSSGSVVKGVGGNGFFIRSYGESYFNGGNVGIGTTGPSSQLHVNGLTQTSGIISLPRGAVSTPAAAGWYRVGVWNTSSNRGGGVIKLSTTGGSISPGTYVIKAYKNWSTVPTLKIETYGSFGYINKARVQLDSTNSTYYLEVYKPVGYAVPFEIYFDGLLGYNPSLSAYTTGTLPNGTVGGTTYKELDFIPEGTSFEKIYASGNVGIGTVSPSAKLDVVGTIECTSLTETSALRFKENIQEDVDTSIIDKLRPVSYDWKETGDKDYGFIAEEVDELDSILTTKEEDGQLIGIKYTKLIPFLVKKIQEQEERIKQLENGKS